VVVLDRDCPVFAGKRGDRVLDAWVFAAAANPVRHVMVGGRFRVRDGRHDRADDAAAAFRRAVSALTPARS
jgi:formimidoylglutamate deiminase